MTNQAETATTTSRLMPWWGIAGWVVLVLQVFGFAIAFDGTPGIDASPLAIAVGIAAFIAGMAGVVVLIARRR